MILKLVIALAPVGFILVLSEFLWRKKLVKGEKARKFIHILAGAWMAFWPVYLPFDGVFILGSMALALLLYSRFTRLFHAIYAVKRRTYGELFYAVSLMVLAFISREPWVFTVSVLLLAVADGGAAVVGRYWGYKNQYFVFGSKNLRKSIAGTVTFVLLTYVCIFIGLVVAHYMMSDFSIMSENALVLLVALPVGATIIENTMPFGLDNLATPAFSAVLLNSLL